MNAVTPWLTPPPEAVGRETLMRVAHEYVGTPYHWWAQIKGVGVDCLTFLYLVYRDAGLIPEFQLPFYSQQWHMHRSEELYLEGVRKWTHEVECPKPADVVLYRVGRCFAHGALVVDWPLIIHADSLVGRVLPTEGTSGFLADRKFRFFSYW